MKDDRPCKSGLYSPLFYLRDVIFLFEDEKNGITEDERKELTPRFADIDWSDR